MHKIKNNIYKLLKKINYNIKLSIGQMKKSPSRQLIIGAISLILLSGLGFGVYKYVTTPRAPNFKTANGGYLYKAKGLGYTAYIGNKENNRPEVNFAVGTGSVVFTPASGNENPPKPVGDGNKAVIFKNIYEGIDFKYQTIPLGIKEDIIVNKPTVIKTFPFFLDFKDVSPQYLTENVKGTAFFDKDGNYLFNFEKPYAVDAKGIRTDNIGINIKKDMATNKYVAIISLDDTWMNDPSRTYPITIDPTIIHDTTSEFATGQMNRMTDTGSGSSPNLTANYQELPTDVNTVALWHMNEASGNILDSSGNGNTGTPTGTTVVTSQAGLGNARSFNGTSNFILQASGSNANVTGDITVEAWINPSTLTAASNPIVHKDSQYSFTIRNDRFVAWADSSNFSFANFGYTDIGLQLNQWQHIAITKTGGVVKIYLNGVEKISRNFGGAITGTSNRMAIGCYYSASSCSYYFPGMIDEVRISNIARTSDEIKYDASNRPYSTYTSDVIELSRVDSWNSLSWTGMGLATGNGEIPYSTDGLVAQWNFNSASGTTATNDAGAGSCGGTPANCNGTLTNMTTTGQDAAVSSGWTSNNRRWGASALMFDGSDDNVTVTRNATLNSTFDGSYSIGMWFKSLSSTTIKRMWGFSDASSGYHTAIFNHSSVGKITFYAGSDSTPNALETNRGNLNDGQWHYVVFQLDGSTQRIYIDGVFDTSRTRVAGTFSDDNLYIGKSVSGTTAAQHFNGVIDATQLYNRALTANEILSNYNSSNIELQTRVGTSTDANDGTWEEWQPITAESSLDNMDSSTESNYNTNTRTLLHFNGSHNSTTFVDDSLVSKTITPSGNAKIVNTQSKFGGTSAFFDGTGDYLTIPDSNDFAFGAGDFTIDFWVRFNSLPNSGSYATLYNQYVNESNFVRIALASNSNPPLYCIFFQEYISGSNTSLIFSPCDNTWETNTWYHIALVRNGNSWNIYRDGVSIVSTTSSTTLTNLAGNVLIGAYGSGYYLNGWLDEYRVIKGEAIWTENFTPPVSPYADPPTRLNNSTDSVIKVEGSGAEKISTGRPEVDDDTIGLWHLDETGGSGAYIKDSSAYARHGTPAGTATTNGISDKARSFAGGTDLINLGVASIVDNLGNLTVEAWVYPTQQTASTHYRVFSKEAVLYVGQYGNQASFYMGNGSAWSVSETAGGTIPLNQWSHISWVKSGTNYYIYINGTLTKSGSTAPATLGTNTGTADQISRNGQPWNGGLDEIRISSIARTPMEIAENYRMGRDHYVSKTISPTNLSSATKLPFYVASDRLGTFMQMTYGESAYANYEPDGNTLGFWHLDEQSGSGAYLRDSSGNVNHGTPAGTATFTQGKVGKARNFVSTGSYVSIPDSDSLDITGAGTLDAWVYPTSVNTNDIIVSKPSAGTWASQNYALGIVSGDVVGYIGNASTSNGVTSTFKLQANKWYHLVFTWNGSTLALYINGVLNTTATQTITPAANAAAVNIGRFTGYSTYDYDGIIDEVHISNIARSADEIRQKYESSTRTHNITIDFKAKLDSGNPIDNSTDLSFTIDETAYGSSAMANHIFLGDKIIVRENYDGTEYIAQGTVNAVNSSTGAITVSSWDTGSAFPASGYTANATVFKWQREYFDLTASLPTHRDAVTRLTYRITDGSSGSNIWLDDLRSSPGYLTNPAGSEVSSSTGNHYFQYRAIFSQNDISVPSSTLTSVTLDYTENSPPGIPTLDSPTNGAANQALLPVLKTTAVDPDTPADDVKYKIILCKDINMTGPSCKTFNQVSDTTGWSASSYASGTQGIYTLQEPLDAATIYYWKSYAIDEAGSNLWGSTQESPYSFTTTQPPIAPTSLLTQGQVNPSKLTTVTPYFSAIHNDPDGDSANYYQVQVNTASDFSGTMMWNTPKTSMATTANGSRSPNITYSGSSLSWGTTYFWRIKFWDTFGVEGSYSSAAQFTLNSAPNIPTLDSPTNGAVNQSFSPTLKTTATDNDSDNLKYQIELCTNSGMSQDCQTFNQVINQTGWSGQNGDGNTTYTPGTQASYTIQTILNVGQKYYWRSYALDPTGTNTWGLTQETPYNFTILETPMAASSCRIKEELKDERLTVLWADNATNEDAYEIQRSVDGGDFSVLQTSMSPNTASYIDSDISEGHTYQYRIAPYFTTGPNYSPWCTTSTLSLQLGTFSIQGLDLKGLILQ